MKFSAALIVIACFLSSRASADSAEARQHYEKATAHFAVGEFAEAAAEYQAAFKEKPDPALLYDAAQAYRLANNPEKALILYRNYLQLYPNEPNVAEVRTQIDKLKDAVAAAEKAKTAPPTGTNEPKHIAPEAGSNESTGQVTADHAEQPAATSAAPQTVTAERPARSTPLYKKWWLWTAVGGVVAAGVVVAVVLTTQPSGTWSNAPDVGPGSKSGLTLMTVPW